MHNDPKLLASSCTICAKIEIPKAQDLLCKDCVHKAIEVIRNSVIGNDELNNVMRQEINSVFEFCDEYRNSKSDNPLRQVHHSIPASISSVSVKRLAIQLQKLELMNSKMKVNGMQKAEAVMSTKVQNARFNIEEMQQKINELKAKLEAKSKDLQELYAERSKSLESDIRLLYNHSIDQTKRYSALIQYQHYQALREVAFPNFQSWQSNKSHSPRKKEKLLLFDLPVIELSSFLSHNNKLTEINCFLENLIRLQIHCVRLFFQNDDSVKLPFLDYLKQLLPDSHFYDLVQEKINFITQDGVPSNPEESETTSPEPQTKPTKLTVSPDETIDKIMIEGNVIRIPISFKTINLQRRTSLMSPDITGSSADLMALNSKLMSPESTSTTNKLPNAEQSLLKSTLKGKRIVITAHKILTKPFSRLKSKEYLKFVLVVVKILVNFQVFFNLTTKHIKGADIKKKALSGTLAGTFNQLRSHGSLLAKATSNPGSVEYDFESILTRLANMDFFFHTQKYLVEHSGESADLKSSSSALLYSSMSQLNNSNISEASEYSEFLVHVDKSQMSAFKKPSKFRELYDNVFNRQLTPVPNTVAENIYGNVSETNSHSDESKLKVSEMENSSSDALAGSSGGTEEASQQNYNIKTIMGDVHKIFAYKNGNGRAGAVGSRTIGPDKDMHLATLSMMAESKAQLEEWDMVSQMYK